MLIDIISKVRLSRWKYWPYTAVVTILAVLLLEAIDTDLLTIPIALLFIFFSFYTSKLVVATFYENFPKYLEIKFLRYFLIAVLTCFIIILFALVEIAGGTGGH